MDFWIYAAAIAFALTAGTIAGGVLTGAEPRLFHREQKFYERIRRYFGLGSIGLMLAAFHWYGFIHGLGAIGAAILFGAFLYALPRRTIPSVVATVLYACAALVLLVIHVFLYPGR